MGAVGLMLGATIMKLQRLRAGFERLLEWIIIALVLALTVLVCLGALFRYIGAALSWYDELASIGLVWLTYYGSALAALKGAHIGVAGLVNIMPRNLRVAVTIFSEACVFAFFILLAWTGLQVLDVLGNDTMVSLDWVPLRLTQSAVPVGAVLFIIAEALRLPKTLAASMFFAEISGSAVADVAALGTILIPAMRSRGYSAEFAAATTSSAASLAIIIPPSIPMILYAVMAQTSVVKLFVAGIIPGIIGAAGLALAAYIQAVRYDFPIEEEFRLTRVWQTLKEATWAFLLPIGILGGIFGGFVTATEGAGLAVAVALFVSTVIYRELDLRELRKACIDGGVQTAVVMLLVASSALIGTFLTEAQMPQKLATAITGLTDDKYVVLLLLNVAFLILGMFLHSAAAIILVVPIVMPMVTAVGIDPIHFGLVLTLNLAIGQQTPPVASVLMAACAIAKTDIWETTRVNWPYILALLIVLFLCTYVPFLSLVLVHLFYGT